MRKSLAFVLATLAIALLVMPALAQNCPKCGRDVGADYRFCPYDGTALPEPHCPKCDRALDREWSFCPWDGTAVAKPHAAAEAPVAKPPAPAPSTPLVETLPRSGPAPEQSAVHSGDSGDKRATNPVDTIDALFRSIAASDEAGIRRLYSWSRFFPHATAAELEGQISSYVKRLVERVKPTLVGSERVPVDIKLGKADARIKVLVRKTSDHATVAEYDFTLVDEGKGWIIAGIKP